MTMYQYGDLPQIPSFPEDHPYAGWNNEHTHPYRQSLGRLEEHFEYNRIVDNGMLRMQRFMHEPTPLTPGLLQAKLDSGIQSQHYGHYEQWPTPEIRYDSPDRTSVSGTSSYATQNEVRSPLPFHYNSPEELTQASYPYPTADHLKGTSFSPDALAGGRSISLRELEYEHEPEPEPTIEETEPVDMKIDAVYEPEPVYIKVDTVPDNYKNYSDSSVNISQRDAESVQPMDPSEGESSDPEYTPRSTRRRRSSASTSSSGGRNGQRRRSHHSRKNSSATTATQNNRVSKRNGRSTVTFSSSKASGDAQAVADAQRHFPCPLATYGCGSTFSSKNEWKRHVGTQHIKIGYWRCDLCATTIDPHDDQTFYHNDFNRKDLFTQHLRRMHAAPSNSSARSQKEYPVNEENIATHQQRCFQTLRDTPPQSQCLFCEETFTGPSSWENRMEHIGRHLEKDRKAGAKFGDVNSWNVDKELEQWLLDEGIIAVDKTGQWKIGDGRPRRHAADDDSEEDI